MTSPYIKSDRAHLALYDRKNNKWVDFGSITSFSDNLTKSVTTVPIASRTSESTVAIESGTRLYYDVRFTYVGGSTGNIPLGDWCETMLGLVDRWQAKEDGHLMDFNISSVDNGPPVTIAPVNPKYPPIYHQNVYITSLSLTYSEGYPDKVEGRATLSVGGLVKVKSASGEVRMMNEYEVRS